MPQLMPEISADTNLTCDLLRPLPVRTEQLPVMGIFEQLWMRGLDLMANFREQALRGPRELADRHRHSSFRVLGSNLDPLPLQRELDRRIRFGEAVHLILTAGEGFSYSTHLERKIEHRHLSPADTEIDIIHLEYYVTQETRIVKWRRPYFMPNDVV